MKALVFMTGGYGDMLMCSPVFVALKNQGYSVTLLTDEHGASPVSSDPNLEKIEIFNPNAPIDAGYDQIFDLSKVLTSGPLKKAPATGSDENYIHALLKAVRAPVAMRPLPAFYPDDEERGQVERFFARHPAQTRVMWVLSGSAMHKQYPWTHSVIKHVASAHHKLQFLLVGDKSCQVLEQEFASLPNVLPLSGRIDIRTTMALAQNCDMVVGPETGVMHAAAAVKDVRKVVFLSHSSKKNLTRFWRNTRSLEPIAKCYPCHQIHTDWKHCHRSESTGAALCATSIRPEIVAVEILGAHQAAKDAA